jgi:hypothetical protein
MYQKKQKIQIIFIVASICIVLGGMFAISTYIKNKQELKTLTQIETELKSNNYSNALALTNKVGDPYNQFYCYYIDKYYELSEFTGNEEDLFTWTNDYFNEFDEIIDESSVPFECTSYWNWLEAKGGYEDCFEEYEQNNEEYREKLKWYPELFSIYEDYKCDYVTLCVNNVKLCENKSNDSIVQINKDDVDTYDSEMDELYVDTVNLLYQFEEEYSKQYDVIDVVTNMEDRILSDLSNYEDEISLNTIYDFGNNDEIYITAEEAEDHYSDLDISIKMQCNIDTFLITIEFYDSFLQGIYGDENIIVNFEEVSPSTTELGYYLNLLYSDISLNIDTDYTNYIALQTLIDKETNNINKETNNILDQLENPDF